MHARTEHAVVTTTLLLCMQLDMLLPPSYQHVPCLVVYLCSGCNGWRPFRGGARHSS
jgi:hypothetical protein